MQITSANTSIDSKQEQNKSVKTDLHSSEQVKISNAQRVQLESVQSSEVLQECFIRLSDVNRLPVKLKRDLATYQASKASNHEGSAGRFASIC